MAAEAEITDKFWKALKHDRTVMLELDIEGEHAQPMTALLENHDRGPIWIFTSRDTQLAHHLGASQAAMMHFVSKGHDVFACVAGGLSADNNPAMIDKLWNPYVAAWYDGGKSDPKLLLLRFDPDEAQIWLNENSMFAGVKILLGHDPKRDAGEKVADVRLNS